MRHRTILKDGTKDRLVISEVIKEWEKKGKLWYVKRLNKHTKLRRDDKVHHIKETELVLKTFQPNVRIPPEVFLVHALGLPDGTRIQDWQTGEERDRYRADPGFDYRKVEQTVGPLPIAFPRE